MVQAVSGSRAYFALTKDVPGNRVKTVGNKKETARWNTEHKKPCIPPDGLLLHDREWITVYLQICVTIASPISVQLARRQPSAIISPVRRPSFRAVCTACSIASASDAMSKL